LKKRFVLIFQEIFQAHPIFEKVEVFTKFPDKERPKFALMIRSASGSSQKLALDNFVRTNIGYSTLANLKGVAGNSIEWVKDDVKNIDKLAAPGFYIVKMTEVNLSAAKFVIDPYLTIEDEELTIQFIEGKEGAYLKNKPVNPGSDIVVALDDGFDFKPDIDYTIDYTTGKILFTDTVLDKDYGRIAVDYQVLGTRTGPHDTSWYTANNTAIPGVVLAFGDRLRVGDEQVVVVENEENENAKVYGGRWSMSFDLIGVAQDADQQERLLDHAVSILWAEWQDKLVDEGIILHDFSLSGEAEDLEIEVPEEYSYTGGINFAVETDWELAMPLISKIRRINIAYGEQSYRQTISNSQEDKYVNQEFDGRMINSGHQVGIEILPPEGPIVLNPNCIGVQTRKY